MAKFEDIKFSRHSGFKGVHGTYTFEDGTTLSVIAGEFAQSIPKMYLHHQSQYRGFEVLIADRYGHLITDPTKKYSGIIGNASREDINNIMNIIESNLK